MLVEAARRLTSRAQLWTVDRPLRPDKVSEARVVVGQLVLNHVCDPIEQILRLPPCFPRNMLRILQSAILG